MIQMRKEMILLDKIYTIGFTQKNAEKFFGLIKNNKITLLVDVRLNNTSQLAAFSKHPDISFFLKEICGCDYKHEILFAPEDSTLSRYKKKVIDWNTYVEEFSATMDKRKIRDYIRMHYDITLNICLLCSEATPEYCHRRLIAEIIHEVFPETEIIHL